MYKDRAKLPGAALSPPHHHETEAIYGEFDVSLAAGQSPSISGISLRMSEGVWSPFQHEYRVSQIVTD
jgi:hypothetical protein